MMKANDLLLKAIEETANLRKNETFIVKDLFKGYEWNRVTRSDRLLLGTLFLNYANNEQDSIIPIDKTSSGQQKYQKR